MPVSFEDDIAKLFTDGDVGCMSPDVPLRDVAYMTDPAGNGEYPDYAHARTVYFRLSPEAGSRRRMPKGGPYWKEPDLALYRKWMAEGFQP